MVEKFCTKCGKKFYAIGREVICPSCKAQAAEETKRAAVERAKMASWAGESVPVRISGRASTVIREYGKAHDVPFAVALDALLKSTAFFEKLGVEWNTIQPYKSRRRDKHATSTTETAQGGKQEGKPQEVTKAAKTTNKSTTSTSKAVGKNASKAVKTSTAGKEGKA